MPNALANCAGSRSGVAQITSFGKAVQAENRRFSLEGLSSQTAVVKAAEIEAALAAGPVRGAYIHVPFCFHKCHYCDFYSIVDSRDRQDAFIDRLTAEIEAAAGRWPIAANAGLTSIFIGGGTPTLLTPAQWRRLLAHIAQRIPVMDGGEFTVEANPETVTAELAATLSEGGVNRVSVGAQSFDPRHLKTLERWHDPANVGRSMGLLRDAGIVNLNVDLIFAVPGQSLADWLADLNAAIALQPSHISCYGLMYEHNTPLTKRMQAGAITPVDDQLEAAMYEATIDRLAAAGYEHYEISNWARAGVSGPLTGAGERHDRAGVQQASRCRHNLLYWRNENWWPLGPSASGHINGVRWKNLPRLGDYLDAAHGPLPPIADLEMVDAPTVAGEQFMLGLRLIEGLALREVDRLLSVSGARAPARRAAIDRHVDAGLLEARDERLRLTRRGLLLANSVLVDLV